MNRHGARFVRRLFRIWIEDTSGHVGPVAGEVVVLVVDDAFGRIDLHRAAVIIVRVIRRATVVGARDTEIYGVVGAVCEVNCYPVFQMQVEATTHRRPPPRAYRIADAVQLSQSLPLDERNDGPRQGEKLLRNPRDRIPGGIFTQLGLIHHHSRGDSGSLDPDDRDHSEERDAMQVGP